MCDNANDSNMYLTHYKCASRVEFLPEDSRVTQNAPHHNEVIHQRRGHLDNTANINTTRSGS